MKKLLAVLMLLVPVAVAAYEYARIGDDGKTVVEVIVSTPQNIAMRTDGPWIFTPKKVGKGYIYQYGLFTSPISTFTVNSSSGVFISSGTKRKL